MKKRILLLGDSYGYERIHNGVADVSFEQTWPQLVKQELSDKFDITCDFKPYRKMLDCPKAAIINKDSEVVVVHAGIVDCYPRPLNERLTMTKNPVLRIIRKLSKMFRKEFIKYIHKSSWVSLKDSEQAAIKMCKMFKRVFFVTVPPVIESHERNTPGALKAIVKFNEMLGKCCKDYPNASLIDIHKVFVSGAYQNYFHPIDTHPNRLGHELYFKQVKEALENI